MTTGYSPAREKGATDPAGGTTERKERVRARAEFFENAAEFTPLLSVDADHAHYLVDTSDQGVSKSLFSRGSRGEMRLLAQGLRVLEVLGIGERVRAGTFVDVGANIGTTTITAMCSHGFARAVSCEPEPHNQQLLELNLAANGLERDVQICRAAIGDRDGAVDLVVNKRRSGGHEVHWSGRDVPADSKAYSLVEVQQVALDSLARAGTLDPDNVTVLWMDAQGHEGHVLKGASSLTERGVPIMMEFFPGMIARHGGLEYFNEAAANHYSHFVSLHRVRGKVVPRFDVNPIGQLRGETEELLSGRRVTDILLIRDPRSRPAGRGGPGRSVESQDRSREAAEDRHLREQEMISAAERREFLAHAESLTPIVAAEIEGATFLVRSSAGATERSLFVHRSHPRVRLLATALTALDDLGFADVRQKALVEARAGTGISTVAAVRWHGFARTIACEPDADVYRVLKLNVFANGLRERVRTVPVAVGEATDGRGLIALDDLVRRGLIAPDATGLVWIDADDPSGALDGAGMLLESKPPLLLRLNSRRSVESLLDRRGPAGGYNQVVPLDDVGTDTDAPHVLVLP